MLWHQRLILNQIILISAQRYFLVRMRLMWKSVHWLALRGVGPVYT